jgi:hypothetical protein
MGASGAVGICCSACLFILLILAIGIPPYFITTTAETAICKDTLTELIGWR